MMKLYSSPASPYARKVRMTASIKGLGSQIEVPTLTGSVKVKIPPGSANGSRLRVRGKGLKSGATEHGDLYVVLSVVTPTTVDDKEREAWQRLADCSTFRPRD